MYHFTPTRVCSRRIDIELDGDTVEYVSFEGGCKGNLQAVSKLIQGKTIDEVAAILEGLECGNRKTSCADQLVKGLREAQQSSL